MKSLLVPALVWLAMIGAMVAYELYCIQNPRPGDTLSEQFWRIFDNPAYGKFLRWQVLSFLAWLFVHLASRGRWA